MRTERLPWLWEDLAYALDGRTAMESLTNDSSLQVAEFGSIDGVADFLFVASAGYFGVQPVGPAGPTIPVSPGFQMFHRTCTPDEPNHFESTPFETPVSYRPDAEANQRAGRDAYLAACAIQIPTNPDLGDLAAVLPIDPTSTAARLPVSDLAWSPGSDTVYFLAGRLGQGVAQLLRMVVGEVGAAQVMFGDLYGPLELALGGTSLLVNQASIYQGSRGPSIASSHRLRQSLVSGAVSPQLILPIPNTWPPGTGQTGVLSPDGATIAFSDAKHAPETQLISVEKGTVSVANLGKGAPLAWDPTGQSILVASPGLLAVLSRDGRSIPIPGNASYPREAVAGNRRYFWSASGPRRVLQDELGVHVLNLATGETTELIEADRVAPPTGPLGVVIATEQVFAWSLQCFGLGETSCNAELRRFSIATGQVTVVARAGGAFPFAVSPDGTKLAIVDSHNLYIKSITP